ncbi:hypothetical protein [Mucilaginibacter antarcticus]|uniref:hypothetical protein n=1 Tax=Mucilaginibacter antarcticus TaxID=1855725 RepID=UPI00363327FD
MIPPGINAGGTTGQLLEKASNADYDTAWVNPLAINDTTASATKVYSSEKTTDLLSLKQNSLGFSPENSANKNTINGYAGLDNSGKVAAALLPSYVDDVLEFASVGALPATGETGKIYVTLDDNAQYRWSGSTYIKLVASPGSTDDVPEGSINFYFNSSRVWNTVLTGVSFLTNAAISATDGMLVALGKLQAQLNGLSALFQPKENQRLSTTDDVTHNNLVLSGTLITGLVDAYASPATNYLTYHPTTKAIVSRTAAEVASDIGAGAGSVEKATLAELNIGTNDAKFATALGLEESKYLGQSGAKISATASGTNTYAAAISPAITAYANTQRFYIRFANANTNASCTLSLNGLASLPLVKGIDSSLVAGDIVADSIHLVAIDGDNARILSVSSLPTVTSGEKVLTIDPSGPQKNYDLQELSVSSTSLTGADFSLGIASVNGLIGQVSYDSDYRYDCIGINQWRRSALNGNLVDLYLADIDDSGGDKTSGDLQAAYPSSLPGQQAWGLNKLYIKKTTTIWQKIAIATA